MFCYKDDKNMVQQLRFDAFGEGEEGKGGGGGVVFSCLNGSRSNFLYIWLRNRIVKMFRGITVP